MVSDRQRSKDEVVWEALLPIEGDRLSEGERQRLQHDPSFLSLRGSFHDAVEQSREQDEREWGDAPTVRKSRGLPNRRLVHTTMAVAVSAFAAVLTYVLIQEWQPPDNANLALRDEAEQFLMQGDHRGVRELLGNNERATWDLSALQCEADAMLALEEGRFGDARELLIARPSSGARNQAMLCLAASKTRLGRSIAMDRAEATAKGGTQDRLRAIEALDLVPERWAVLEQVRLMVDARMLTEARRRLDDWISVHPTDSDSLVLRGIVRYQQDAFAEAKKDFLAVLDTDPTRPDVIHFLMRVEERLSNQQESQTMWR